MLPGQALTSVIEPPTVPKFNLRELILNIAARVQSGACCILQNRPQNAALRQHSRGKHRNEPSTTKNGHTLRVASCRICEASTVLILRSALLRASRRMDATLGLAAILRDGAEPVIGRAFARPV